MRKELMAAMTLAALAPLAMAQSDAPAPATAPAYDAAAAKAAIATLADELEKNFVFPDTAKRYAAALRAKLAAGGYDAVTDGYTLAGVVTADLQEIAPDGHLAMFAPGGPQSQRVGQPSTQQQIGSAPLPPPPMEQAGMIAPGIAYVRFNGFFGQPETLKAFTAFLDANAGAKTLIIDARTHRGGGLDEMDLLFPRIFDKPQTVMIMDTRASFADGAGSLPFRSLVKVDAPAELARTEHRVTPLSPASPWAKTKIYYLTSPRTASAAEHLASALQGTKRATLVGATTAGAGHYGGTAPLGGGYSAFVPVGRSYFPGGDGWEQVGIKPDIAVAPERALYDVLVREGVPAAQAETLSASHMPKGSMERRELARH